MRLVKILAVQVLLGLTLVEIGLRIYNPLPFRVRGGRIVLPVHRRYTLHNSGATKLEPVTHHTKNSLGFRGPDPPSDYARHLTLITIGGSTTECLFLSDGKTWTDVLARALARDRADVWVNWRAEWVFLTTHVELAGPVENFRRVARAKEAGSVHQEIDLTTLAASSPCWSRSRRCLATPSIPRRASIWLPASGRS